MTNENIKNITKEINNNTSNDIVGVSYGLKIVEGKLTNEKAIIYTVKEKKPIENIDEKDLIPREIEIDGEKVKTDVVEGIIKPHGYGMCDNSFYEWMNAAPTNRNKFRPLKGGISTTNLTTLGNYVGTLGFIAVDNDTDSLVAVSNNHVYVNDAFFTSERDSSGVITDAYTPSGHTVSQPNEVGNYGSQNRIGILKKYQPLETQNTVDVAVSTIDDLSLIDVNTSWMQEGITGMTSPPRFATTQEIDTLLSDPSTEYYSAGRTTGAKGEGLIKLLNYASDSSIYISYNKQGTESPVFMNDTFELIASGSTTPAGDFCYYPSYGGDSGSAILSIINNDWVIVGLLYGGRYAYNNNDPLGNGMSPIQTLCCRIDNIAQALNIRAWDGTLNGINISDLTSAETFVSSGQTNDKNVVIDGKTFWQMGMVNNTEFPADNIPTQTPTSTPSQTPTNTPTNTPTPTVTSSSVETATPTNTPTSTLTPTVTSTSTSTPTPTPSISSSVTPTPTGTPAGTPRETPTPTPTDPNSNRLVPTIGYNATFVDCLNPPGTYTGYVNDTLWSTISGNGVSNVYILFNTNCYNLVNVDVTGGPDNVPDGAIYIGVQSDIVTNCCPPEPTPTVTTTVTEPPVNPGGELSDCYLYEVTNNGTSPGNVTYIVCGDQSTTFSLIAGDTIYICSENVPQYTNEGFTEFGLVKNDFYIVGTSTQPVNAITGYDYSIGNEPNDVFLNNNAGQITFQQPIGVTGTTFGPVTFNINVEYYYNTVIGGCGSVDFYIYKEGSSNLTLIGTQSNFTPDQTDTFSLTYTDSNGEYDKYYMIFASGCESLAYNTFSFTVEQSGDYVNISHNNLGPCNQTLDCDSFIISYEADGGCGPSTTYQVTVSNIPIVGGPYNVTLNTTQESYQSTGEDVVFTNVSPGVNAIIFNDLSGACDKITRSFYLPVLNQTNVLSELITAPNCFDCDGEVQITYEGFSQPVTIEVYTGLTGNPNVLLETFNNINSDSYIIDGICGGTNYRFQVTGANGCTNKVITTIPSTTAVSPLFSVDVVNSPCGVRDSIRILVQNNGSPITYSITGDTGYTDSYTTTQGQHTFEQIPSGIYDIQIITSDGCIKDLGPVTVTNPDMYVLRITSVVDAGCDGNTGSFNLQILPGEIEVQTPIDVFVKRNPDDEIFFQVIDSEQTNFSVTNLIGGTYEIEIIDVNGCSQKDYVTIGGGTGLDFTVDSTDCTENNSNGSAEIIVNQSGEEVTVTWSTGQQGVYSINGLSEGTYSVTVSDESCTLTKSFTIDCGGEVVEGDSVTVVCSNTFTNQGAGIDTFEQLTQNALNSQYSVINESCDYIPSYEIEFNITNITNHSDIIINQTIYVGNNINDVLTNEVWTTSIESILNDLAINYDFIASGYIFNQNFFRIESNCASDSLSSAFVNLRLEISIDEQC